MRLKKILNAMTKPSKSNLTETGQMLNDITYSTSQNSIRIFFKTERSDTIALYHETGTSKMPARPFFHLTKTEAKEVNRILERNRNDFIRRNFSQ
jgi:phage gpG-like protein